MAMEILGTAEIKREHMPLDGLQTLQTQMTQEHIDNNYTWGMLAFDIGVVAIVSWSEDYRDYSAYDSGPLVVLMDVRGDKPVYITEAFVNMSGEGDLKDGLYPAWYFERVVPAGPNAGVITWSGADNEWALAFTVSEQQLHMGVPVKTAFNGTNGKTIASPVNNDYPGALIRVATFRHATTYLQDGVVAHTTQVQHYQTPDVFTAWQYRMVTCKLTLGGTLGNEITVGDWYFMGEGYPYQNSFSVPYKVDQAGSYSRDGRVHHLWHEEHRNPNNTNERGYPLVLEVWDWNTLTSERRTLLGERIDPANPPVIYNTDSHFQMNTGSMLLAAEGMVVEVYRPSDGLTAYLVVPTDGSQQYVVDAAGIETHGNSDASWMIYNVSTPTPAGHPVMAGTDRVDFKPTAWHVAAYDIPATVGAVTQLDRVELPSAPNPLNYDQLEPTPPWTDGNNYYYGTAVVVLGSRWILFHHWDDETPPYERYAMSIVGEPGGTQPVPEPTIRTRGARAGFYSKGLSS